MDRLSKHDNNDKAAIMRYKHMSIGMGLIYKLDPNFINTPTLICYYKLFFICIYVQPLPSNTLTSRIKPVLRVDSIKTGYVNETHTGR